MKWAPAVLAAAAALMGGGSRSAAPAAAAKGRFVTVNGLHMYYEEQGSGPPLVLLHGGGSTAQTSFGAIMPRLARRHRVIAPEQQAHGHSGDRPGPLSFEQMADDTAALLGQLGVTQADVLGFSNGGVVAMQLVMRHPQIVRRLIVCSAYYAHDGMPPQFWEGFARASLADMPPALRAAFSATAPDPAQVRARFEKLVALMKDFKDIPEDALRTIGAPTLIIVADHDVMSVEHEARLASLLPHASLAVMPHSIHGTYLGALEGARPGSPLPDIALSITDAFLADRL